jgi:spoIIIJ-associated protein
MLEYEVVESAVVPAQRGTRKPAVTTVRIRVLRLKPPVDYRSGGAADRADDGEHPAPAESSAKLEAPPPRAFAQAPESAPAARPRDAAASEAPPARPRRERSDATPRPPRAASKGTATQHSLPEDPVTRAETFVRGVLAIVGVRATVTGSDEAGVARIEIDAPDEASQRVLDASTLASLQYLAGCVVAQVDPERRVVLDAGGRRQLREDALAAMAGRLAATVLATGKVAAVYPMSSLDRRAVHQAVSDLGTVVSQSQGAGAFRRLLVAPEG